MAECASRTLQLWFMCVDLSRTQLWYWFNQSESCFVLVKNWLFFSLKGACYCSSQLMYYWSWWIRYCCDVLDLIYQIVCHTHHLTQSPLWYSMCPQIQRELTHCMCSILSTTIILFWLKSVVSISLGFFLIQCCNIRKYWHVLMLYFSLMSKECNKRFVFLIKRCEILLGGGVGILPFHEFSHLFFMTNFNYSRQ